MLSNIINTGRERLVAAYIKSVIKDYAEIVDVSINKAQQTMTFELILKGDTYITTAEVTGYEVYRDEYNTYFRYHEFKTSKEWLNIIVQRFSYLIVTDNQFIIPNKLLKTFLPIFL